MQRASGLHPSGAESRKSRQWLAAVIPLLAIAILGSKVRWNQCQGCGVQEYEHSFLGIYIEALCEREYDEYGTYTEWKDVHGQESCSHLFEPVRNFSPVTELQDLRNEGDAGP